MKKYAIAGGLILAIGLGGYLLRDNLKATFTVLDDSEDLSWVIDEGFRLDNASNPRIMSYEDGVVELIYEYRATELKDEPGARGYVTYSDDGLDFEVGEQQMGDQHRGDGVLLPDGTQRRYMEDMQNGYVISQSSTDGGETWEDDEGYRYDLNEIDDGWMGVRTFWVNEDGSVGFIYNTNTILQPDGTKAVAVRLAVSEPGDNGMNFELVNENLIPEQSEEGFYEMSADPVVVLPEEGGVRLVVMRQGLDDVRPPLGRTGEILSYFSEDGVEFESEGSIVHWSDFEEFEVYSLNDPKIMQLDDGRFRVYVAAQIPDPEAEESGEVRLEDGSMFHAGYKWILVSITTE